MISKLLRPEILVFLVPIVAIAGYYINKAQKMSYEYEERRLKIEAGIDPDAEG